GPLTSISTTREDNVPEPKFLHTPKNDAQKPNKPVSRGEKVGGKRLKKSKRGCPRRAVVAYIRGVRTFLVIHALYKFGDDGVHVRVAFAVRVRGEVQGHIVEENGEVGTVVEIEAAKKILVGFAAAGVLSDDDTGNRFQDFSRTK